MRAFSGKAHREKRGIQRRILFNCCKLNWTMTFSTIIIFAASAGSLLAAVDKQNLTNIEDVPLVDRLEALEDLVRTVVEDFAYERKQWLAEKQSLQLNVNRLQTMCASTEVVFRDDYSGNDHEAGSETLEVEAGNTVRQRGERDVFAPAADSGLLEPIVTQLTARVNEISSSLQAMKNQMNFGFSVVSTSVYVRWGSSTCPTSAALIYSGSVGGSYFDYPGAAANLLCLPLSGISLLDSRGVSYATLYGAEYRTGDLHDQKDPVCAVCQTSRPSSVMIPAMAACPSDWTLEYNGYLMAGAGGDKAASEYVCVDSKMEERQGSEEMFHANVLYYTHTVCGSLPCPPYSDQKIVTCVVCSK